MKPKGWVHMLFTTEESANANDRNRMGNSIPVYVEEIPQDAVRWETVVEHYVHRGGIYMGRLPVQDYIPAHLIGKKVQVLIWEEKP